MLFEASLLLRWSHVQHPAQSGVQPGLYPVRSWKPFKDRDCTTSLHNLPRRLECPHREIFSLYPTWTSCFNSCPVVSSHLPPARCGGAPGFYFLTTSQLWSRLLLSPADTLPSPGWTRTIPTLNRYNLGVFCGGGMTQCIYQNFKEYIPKRLPTVFSHLHNWVLRPSVHMLTVASLIKQLILPWFYLQRTLGVKVCGTQYTGSHPHLVN